MNDAALQLSAPFWKQKVNYTKWTARHGGMFPAGTFAAHYWTQENKQQNKQKKRNKNEKREKKKPLLVAVL